MNRYTFMAVLAVKCGLALTVSPAILAADSDSVEIEEIIIKGIRDNRQSRGATGLDLSAYETPQSLTILEAKTIRTLAWSISTAC